MNSFFAASDTCVRRRFDQELADDLSFIVEEWRRTRWRRALSGTRFHLREESRDAWGWIRIDLSPRTFASRSDAAETPGFTLAAILMLAIGIGVNVAAFGFFNLIGPATASIPLIRRRCFDSSGAHRRFTHPRCPIRKWHSSAVYRRSQP